MGRINLIQINQGIKVDGPGEREGVDVAQFKSTINGEASEQPDPIPIDEEDGAVFLEEVFPGRFLGGGVGWRGGRRRGCGGRGGRGGGEGT